MIKFFPPINELNNLKTQPQEGERKFLTNLEQYFKKSNRDLEVYFQPNINGFCPDVVVIEKNLRIWIVEIKDWHYQSYNITKYGWQLKDKNGIKKFPFKQVCNYKKIFYTLLFPELTERLIKNSGDYALIKTIVYFHNIKKDAGLKKEEEKKLKGNRDLQYTDYLFSDSEEKDYISSFSKFLKKEIQPLTDQEYTSIKRYLQPLKYLRKFNKPYTKEQREVINIENKTGQKVYGSGGSGKTFVLAKKVVNCLEKSNWKANVLILTYNLTLVNYIRDRISEILPSSYKHYNESITITNYHQLIGSTISNISSSISTINKQQKDEKDEKDEKEKTAFFEDINVFEKVKDEIKKYDEIFVDEAQDYKSVWFEILKKYFLKPKGKWFIVADPKQNIYNNCSWDEYKMPKVPVPGPWTEKLKNGCRYSGDSKNIINLLNSFSKKFLKNKYFDEKINEEQNYEKELFSSFEIEYYKINYSIITQKLMDIYNDLKKDNIHPNDITFISNTQNFLYDFEYKIRTTLKEKAKTTFLTKELMEKEKKNIEKNIETGFKNLALKDAFTKYFEHLKEEKLLSKSEYSKFGSIIEELENGQKPQNSIIDEFENYRKNKFIKPSSSEYIKSFDKSRTKYIKKKVSDKDRPFKFNFYQNSGLIKISTIHSFKGLESPCVVLLIAPFVDENGEIVPFEWNEDRTNIIVNNKETEEKEIVNFFELLYVGLSRAEKKIIIVNAVEVPELDEFFEEQENEILNYLLG